MSDKIIDVNKDTFDPMFGESQNKVFLVDFWAEWCGPCKMIAPVLDQMADENPSITFMKVNVDENPELAAKFGIRSIPTLLLLNKTKDVIVKQVGALPKHQLEEKLLVHAKMHK